MGTVKNKPFCRFCNADPASQNIRAEFVFGGKPEHKFWKCSKCELIYLWPVPSEKEEKRFYSQEFEKFMSIRSGQKSNWLGAKVHIRANQGQLRRRWKFIEKEIVPGKDLLEIGCSSGFMLDAFKKAGMNCWGTEPSRIFLSFLKKRHSAFEDLCELKQQYPRKKFDLIVHFFVLEHIRDTVRFIREQLELLNPGGKIIAEVPCVNDPLVSVYKIPAFEKFYWSIAHHYYFSPKSLSKILDRLNCRYEFIPEQRYDISNHLVWMQEGKPGGQKRYSNILSDKTANSYSRDLKKSWNCDTFFVYIQKR